MPRRDRGLERSCPAGCRGPTGHLLCLCGPIRLGVPVQRLRPTPPCAFRLDWSAQSGAGARWIVQVAAGKKGRARRLRSVSRVRSMHVLLCAGGGRSSSRQGDAANAAAAHRGNLRLSAFSQMLCFTGRRRWPRAAGVSGSQVQGGKRWGPCLVVEEFCYKNIVD